MTLYVGGTDAPAAKTSKRVGAETYEATQDWASAPGGGFALLSCIRQAAHGLSRGLISDFPLWAAIQE